MAGRRVRSPLSHAWLGAGRGAPLNHVWLDAGRGAPSAMHGWRERTGARSGFNPAMHGWRDCFALTPTPTLTPTLTLTLTLTLTPCQHDDDTTPTERNPAFLCKVYLESMVDGESFEAACDTMRLML